MKSTQPNGAGDRVGDEPPSSERLDAWALPREPMEDRLYREILRIRESGQRGALATVVGVEGSSPAHSPMKILVREDGSCMGTVGGGCLEEEVKRLGREVILDERTARFRMRLTATQSPGSSLVCGGSVEVFIEPLGAPSLVLFGGGHVARALAEFAARLGYRLSVTDDRSEYASVARFPMAATHLVAEPVQAVHGLSLGPSTAVVLMTRSHALDQEVLHELHRSQVELRYLGMIGSATKVRETFDALVGRGVPRRWLRQVRSPVGLRIGARTAEEIAVAVLAELIALRRGVSRVRWSATGEGESRTDEPISKDLVGSVDALEQRGHPPAEPPAS